MLKALGAELICLISRVAACNVKSESAKAVATRTFIKLTGEDNVAKTMFGAAAAVLKSTS